MLTLTLLVAAGLQSGLTCPVMGGPANFKAGTTYYNGAQYAFCCAGCDTTFAKAPTSTLEKATKEKRVSGLFLFDPVTKTKIAPDKAVAHSDYAGIRFSFASAENKANFDKNPKAFATLPKKEALYCPVMGESIANYTKASGYADFEGVRYYFCCAGCDQTFAKEPSKYVANVKAKIRVPVAEKVAQ
ncbi:MAG TPA: YHS domain-containing protein [Fimbriimonadaceae bacterium]|nr:YHS domain-containing protein [Fimbriimonadaceae bacterium]